MTDTHAPVTPVVLSPDTLDAVATTGVAVPGYDRTGLTAGIVHFGVGGFHRAHQAMVIDRLLAAGEARDFAICGVGVLEQDRRMKEVMDAQGGLYTLVLKHPDGRREARVIGSIVEYLLAVDDPEGVVEKMASPETRIVSLTVTEGGYNFHHVTGEFDETNPAVRSDLEAVAAGGSPHTTFGLVTAALQRRRERGIEPFTVMSCDNIPGNGHVAKKMFSAYAALVDPELATWMRESVSFPNCMVDRITPVTSDDDRAEVREGLGIDDAWPVVAEPFFQWVLEDDFPLGRPPYEDADVQLVDDVEPYEFMKLRLLNASHQGLCYFGYLSGYRYAHEATTDPAIAGFLRDYMDLEATPTLPEVPGIDLDDYKATLIERFQNPEVRDTLARLCAESSDRIPKWLLPVVRENLAAGGDVRRSAAIVASWARYAEAVDEQGDPITIVDRLADRLTAAALTQRDDRLAFLRDREVFGDLVDDDRFTSAYLDALDQLIADGAHATVERLAALPRG
ncbi:mannitol dehydrogenase family protein [Frigoribacterium sp. VKM Ac-1396]|uniref:mannitol dehydrogenase family protein n=1 Tax=Frigoribacterium sp. VKM Ac-1396 TaxID=2783821 RepID=UPI00188C2DDF|nr:mannitol dehydrogenase family protein [Frigoribacterium sp. VKM Ac-1396]MBF4601596.1 mannitol dehydrogenase family protein [Frigoribacterium sp. VKM Ac-1396]